MLIKNGGMKMEGMSKPLRLPGRIRGASAALLLGGCFLLLGSQLYAQDSLLKEYIYLDGRLLAVERQVVTLAAQQPAVGANPAVENGLAMSSPFGNRASALSGSEGATAISRIQIVPSTGAFHGPVFAGNFASEKVRNSFMAGDDFTLQLGSYRWFWKASGIAEDRNGGNDDGL